MDKETPMDTKTTFNIGDVIENRFGTFTITDRTAKTVTIESNGTTQVSKIEISRIGTEWAAYTYYDEVRKHNAGYIVHCQNAK
jgi:hypothetical protein